MSKTSSKEFGKKLIEAIASGNPSIAAKVEYHLTLHHCTTGQTLREIELEYGTDDLAGLISMLILRTANFFNLGNNINEDQALETAYLLMETYPAETLEDFTLVFKNAKTGKYGELYNRLDGQTIFRWMEKHLDQKAELRERIHQEQKSQGYKQDQNTVLLLETTSEGKPIIEALKKAIDFDEQENDREKDLKYQKIKQEFIAKKILESNIHHNSPDQFKSD